MRAARRTRDQRHARCSADCVSAPKPTIGHLSAVGFPVDDRHALLRCDVELRHWAGAGIQCSRSSGVARPSLASATIAARRRWMYWTTVPSQWSASPTWMLVSWRRRFLFHLLTFAALCAMASASVLRGCRLRDPSVRSRAHVDRGRVTSSLNGHAIEGRIGEGPVHRGGWRRERAGSWRDQAGPGASTRTIKAGSWVTPVTPPPTDRLTRRGESPSASMSSAPPPWSPPKPDARARRSRESSAAENSSNRPGTGRRARPSDAARFAVHPATAPPSRSCAASE